MRALWIVGLGSFLGGCARYGLSRWVQTHLPGAFPFGTMAVNLAGCLLIGVLYGLFERGRIADPDFRLFAVAGFCGGFTTFSTFAGEGLSLFQAGQFFSFVAYAGLSLVLGLAMVFAGQYLVRMF